MATHNDNPTHQQPLPGKKEGRDTPQATWADRVRVTDSSTRHTLDPIPQQPAGSRLKIPTGMKLLNVDQWSRCMIGFFTGCRLDYARLCVELDARLPFIHHFEVESPLTQEPVKVNVEYEWKPSRYEVCQSFGHKCAMPEPVPEAAGKGKEEMVDQTQRQGRPMTREKHQHKRDASHRTRPEVDNQIAVEQPLRREGKQPMADASPTRSPMQKLHVHKDGMQDDRDPITTVRVHKTDAEDEVSSGDSHTLTAGETNIRTVPVVRKKKKGRNDIEARGL
ncbi:hypothetical protein OIU79_030248 [Salix purpurea]|uniref:Uncharacterized protein n=1 Tax=Salix purpurea TaxID=77065 RepID=A0A9Q0NIH3_SALPP|nr:hypothetical protein OIU79_030248 [Salix purpurea]